MNRKPFPSRRQCCVVAATLLLALQGCGGAGRDSPAVTVPDNPDGEPGKVYDVYLDSQLDGETIAITVMEPSLLRPGETYPLILNSHGYGGSRMRQPSAFAQRLRDAGYAVLSLDERGHAESGGLIMALDPDFEGRDWVQVLDWAEDNLPWLRYAPDVRGQTNLVLGAYGGSYGGGFQHLVMAVDPQRRMDAMVPDITWHELFYAFYHNEVFKTAWLTLLSAAGNAGGGGRQADFINQSFAFGIASNEVPDNLHAPFLRNGMSNYCNSGQVYQVDVLYSQGMRDLLFNFNEAYWNYQCMQAQGGDVRLFTHQSGHILPGLQDTGASACGELTLEEASFAWFEDKLQGRGSTAAIPEICFSLADGDAVHSDTVPVGASDGRSLDIPDTSILQGSGAQASGESVIDLGVVEADTLLLGIAPISLTITDPLGLNAGDPRVWVQIAVQRGGAGPWQAVDDQVYGFRGYGTDEDFLPGVAERLAAGDRYGLLLSGYHEFYSSAPSRQDALVTVSGTVSLPLRSP